MQDRLPQTRPPELPAIAVSGLPSRKLKADELPHIAYLRVVEPVLSSLPAQWETSRYAQGVSIRSRALWSAGRSYRVTSRDPRLPNRQAANEKI